jgi:hypothetical protein
MQRLFKSSKMCYNSQISKKFQNKIVFKNYTIVSKTGNYQFKEALLFNVRFVFQERTPAQSAPESQTVIAEKKEKTAVETVRNLQEKSPDVLNAGAIQEFLEKNPYPFGYAKLFQFIDEHTKNKTGSGFAGFEELKKQKDLLKDHVAILTDKMSPTANLLKKILKQRDKSADDINGTIAAYEFMFHVMRYMERAAHLIAVKKQECGKLMKNSVCEFYESAKHGSKDFIANVLDRCKENPMTALAVGGGLVLMYSLWGGSKDDNSKKGWFASAVSWLGGGALTLGKLGIKLGIAGYAINQGAKLLTGTSIWEWGENQFSNQVTPKTIDTFAKLNPLYANPKRHGEVRQAMQTLCYAGTVSVKDSYTLLKQAQMHGQKRIDIPGGILSSELSPESYYAGLETLDNCVRITDKKGKITCQGLECLMRKYPNTGLYEAYTKYLIDSNMMTGCMVLDKPESGSNANENKENQDAQYNLEWPQLASGNEALSRTQSAFMMFFDETDVNKITGESKILSKLSAWAKKNKVPSTKIVDFIRDYTAKANQTNPPLLKFGDSNAQSITAEKLMKVAGAGDRFYSLKTNLNKLTNNGTYDNSFTGSALQEAREKYLYPLYLGYAKGAVNINEDEKQKIDNFLADIQNSTKKAAPNIVNALNNKSLNYPDIYKKIIALINTIPTAVAAGNAVPEFNGAQYEATAKKNILTFTGKSNTGLNNFEIQLSNGKAQIGGLKLYGRNLITNQFYTLADYGISDIDATKFLTYVKIAEDIAAKYKDKTVEPGYKDHPFYVNTAYVSTGIQTHHIYFAETAWVYPDPTALSEGAHHKMLGGDIKKNDILIIAALLQTMRGKKN